MARESRPLQFVDGKNKVFDGRITNDSRNQLQALADDLVRRNLDVLVASSTAEAIALKNATRTIPIVFVVASDPVADGLVESLARPGGNVTGVTTVATALAGKRLEILKETIPEALPGRRAVGLHRVQAQRNIGKKVNSRRAS